MHILPLALTELIEALGRLPGVGPRTAERYAYYLIRHDRQITDTLTRSLDGIHGKIGYCKKTFALIDANEEYSPLYTDQSRNKQLIAVVAEPFDIIALEKTGQFNGTYHVLGGLISPIDGVEPEQLHIPELLARIDEDKVIEIILATSANVEGESTALYIQRQLEGRDVTISRLARGLAVGIDIEYADHITLGRALEGRTKL